VLNLVAALSELAELFTRPHARDDETASLPRH
jgi:hypothetical protein